MEALAKGAVRFSRRYTVKELRIRWRALLYDPDIGPAAAARMLEAESLPPPAAAAPAEGARAGATAAEATLRPGSLRAHYYLAKRRRVHDTFSGNLSPPPPPTALAPGGLFGAGGPVDMEVKGTAGGQGGGEDLQSKGAAGDGGGGLGEQLGVEEEEATAAEAAAAELEGSQLLAALVSRGAAGSKGGGGGGSLASDTEDAFSHMISLLAAGGVGALVGALPEDEAAVAAQPASAAADQPAIDSGQAGRSPEGPSTLVAAKLEPLLDSEPDSFAAAQDAAYGAAGAALPDLVKQHGQPGDPAFTATPAVPLAVQPSAWASQDASRSSMVGATGLAPLTAPPLGAGAAAAAALPLVLLPAKPEPGTPRQLWAPLPPLDLAASGLAILATLREWAAASIQALHDVRPAAISGSEVCCLNEQLSPALQPLAVDRAFDVGAMTAAAAVAVPRVEEQLLVAGHRHDRLLYSGGLLDKDGATNVAALHGESTAGAAPLPAPVLKGSHNQATGFKLANALMERHSTALRPLERDEEAAVLGGRGANADTDEHLELDIPAFSEIEALVRTAVPDLYFYISKSIPQPVLTSVRVDAQSEKLRTAAHCSHRYAQLEILDMDLDPGPDEELPARIQARRLFLRQQRAALRLELTAAAAQHRRLSRKGALALLYGRSLHYYVTKLEVSMGRSTQDSAPDIDVGQEGNASKAIIKLKEDGLFYLRNVGRKTLLVNNKTVENGQRAILTNYCLLEVGGMRLIFEINQLLVAGSVRVMRSICKRCMQIMGLSSSLSFLGHSCDCHLEFLAYFELPCCDLTGTVICCNKVQMHRPQEQPSKFISPSQGDNCSAQWSSPLVACGQPENVRGEYDFSVLRIRGHLRGGQPGIQCISPEGTEQTHSVRTSSLLLVPMHNCHNVGA
eukprot:SM000107S14075  [mRNA]  locus=s107:294589:299129:+ [translate_table: standard]